MNFINNENIQLLWGVISNNNPSITRDFHIEQMKYFLSSSLNSDHRNIVLSKTDLMTINKKYIAYIVQSGKKQSFEKQSFEKSLTNGGEIDTPWGQSIGVTAEELQNIKREKFNDELSKKQLEFSQFLQKPNPPTLNFNEDKDTPISKMEELISQTITQRALDVAQFKKQLPPQPSSQTINTSNLITITDTDVIVDKPIILDELPKQKHISWNDESSNDDLSIHNRMTNVEDKLNNIIQLLTLLNNK